MPDIKAKFYAFLSLKWKILSLLGSMILLLMATLISFAFNEQMNRFELERDNINTRFLAQTKAQFDDFAFHISKVASLVATITSSIDTNAKVSAKQLRSLRKQRIETAWITLQVDYGLESILIYDPAGVLVEQWSSTPTLDQDLAKVHTAIEQEKSITWVNCSLVCQQYAVAPILSNGQVTGAVVISANIAELMLSFRRLANADIGFLLQDSEAKGQEFLPNIGMRVAGLTNGGKNTDLLKKTTHIPSSEARSWIRIVQNGEYYELIFKVFDEAKNGKCPAMIVIIDDITQPYQTIRKQTKEILKAGGLVSLLVLGLIYVLLNKPLRRATSAAIAIPLLGEHHFEEVRSRIRIRQHPFLKDEVDLLYESALQLTDHLETLELEADRHRDEMFEMVNRISLAHEFSERILDTAQVIILTQSDAGLINSINHFGEQLLGWDKSRLPEKPLQISKWPFGELEGELLDAFQNIISGSLNHYYHECELICVDGSQRYFAWHHSRLEGDEIQVLSVAIDITQRKENEAKIFYLAEHDQLTGLMNRQRFLTEVDEILPKIKRYGYVYTLLYLDLDGFKYVNDVSGHQAGDLVLGLVAKELLEVIRGEDVLARLGGDELAILLFDCNQESAIVVAEKINTHLTSIKYPGLVGDHYISASIGIVEVADDKLDVKQLLANADIAMYQAKSKGGARWHVYSEGEQLLEKLQERILMEDQIKQALRDQRFIMVYQPILDIRRNCISHYEALVRMLREDGSMVPPMEFIEVAEKAGLIRELDHYVVNLVIRHWASLMEEGKQHKVAINLSGNSMTDTTLLQQLQGLFAEFPKLPSKIIFEITETAAVADFASAREFIETVRGFGCAFSLDDFGVGFSSFYYVKHLPVDYVKLDGSFIRDLADSPDDQIFVRALTEVARGFGKATVAEFVGDERSLALLRGFGVDYAQGYFIGKPSAEII